MARSVFFPVETPEWYKEGELPSILTLYSWGSFKPPEVETDNNYWRGMIILDEDLTRRHVQYNLWLEVQCYWYYVYQIPQFVDGAYDLIKSHVLQCEKNDTFGEYPVPNRRNWNHLPCRYSRVVVDLFLTIKDQIRRPIMPMYPWISNPQRPRGYGVFYNALPSLKKMSPVAPPLKQREEVKKKSVIKFKKRVEG